MQEEEKRPLAFPVNCPSAQDYFSGFGSKELMILLVSAGISLILMIILWNSFGQIIALVTSFSIISITFVLTRRNQQQESIVDQIVQIYKYYKAQKKYEYEYYDEFGVEVDCYGKKNKTNSK